MVPQKPREESVRRRKEGKIYKEKESGGNRELTTTFAKVEIIRSLMRVISLAKVSVPQPGRQEMLNKYLSEQMKEPACC